MKTYRSGAHPHFDSFLDIASEEFGNTTIEVLRISAIWAFGIYWLVKMKELSLSGIERRALKCGIDMNISSLIQPNHLLR
jgi:hypothetical protein